MSRPSKGGSLLKHAALLTQNPSLPFGNQMLQSEPMVRLISRGEETMNGYTIFSETMKHDGSIL
jgi:hypothetical protein